MKTENKESQEEAKQKTARVSRHVYDEAYEKMMSTLDKVKDAFSDNFERKTLAIENNPPIPD